jgi:hypothetical protein
MANTPSLFSDPVKATVYDPNTQTWVPMTQPGGPASGDASAAKQDIGNASLASIDAKVATVATEAKQNTGNTAVVSIDGKTPPLGQALAAASVPVILPSATITTLTPPAAITGFALEAGGNLAAIKADVDKIPSQGQALAAGSTPVVLTAIQVAALTPPAAITGFGLEATQLLQATAAKQDIGNTSLGSIDTKLTSQATAANQTAEATLVGAVTETAPATDTASSGLNGRLQRIAQRLTSLIALLPSALSNGFFQVSLKETVSVPVTGTFYQSTQPVSLAAEPTYGGKTITYVPVNQSVAGATVLAVADATKKHKVLGVILTMSLAGTLKFSDGVADLLGPCDIASAGGFVAPTSLLPYTETGAINRALTLTTTLGAARGVVIVLTEA